MTAEATHFDGVPAMAAFAIGHLHTFVWSAPKARDGMAPNVAAVTADAVLFVNSRLIRFAVASVTIGAIQPGAVRVTGMRKPHMGGLPGIHQPRCFLRRFQVRFDENAFRFGSAQLGGVAS